jgi:Tfp pilus assembly protein PilX
MNRNTGKKEYRKKENSKKACPSKLQRSRGVAILFTVLTAILLLSIGLSIVSISIRQVTLSSTGRESEYAFYAANTALECALYWDLQIPDIDTASNKRYFAHTGSGQSNANINNVKCSNNSLEYFNSDLINSDSDNMYTFWVRITNTFTNTEQCAEVEIKKERYTDTNGNPKIRSTIQTRGYNVSDCDSTSPKAVERGLELSYTN